MSNIINIISREIIEDKIQQIYHDLNSTYYYSCDFSSPFYILLANLGFISTSFNHEEYGDVLLPEIQEAYAVLDFKNLHISKKVKKLFTEDYSLVQGKNLNIIIPQLKQFHGEDCWLTDSYIELLYNLEKYSLKQDNFELTTTLLYKETEVTSGEIGYFIGNVYTSLTGFSNRKYNNWGTFQLALLAGELERKGLAFWNLGHPYMEYKLKLGAKVLSRKDFLHRWVSNTTVPIGMVGSRI